MQSPLPSIAPAASATILVVVVVLCGCELFKVGGGSMYAPEIERNQRTAMGVVHLWKAELDSGNFAGVTELMRHPSGRQLLAMERHELADDLQHWKKVIGGKPITSTTADTISATTFDVDLTVDYIRHVHFETTRQEGAWWVVHVK